VTRRGPASAKATAVRRSASREGGSAALRVSLIESSGAPASSRRAHPRRDRLVRHAYRGSLRAHQRQSAARFVRSRGVQRRGTDLPPARRAIVSFGRCPAARVRPMRGPLLFRCGRRDAGLGRIEATSDRRMDPSASPLCRGSDCNERDPRILRPRAPVQFRSRRLCRSTRSGGRLDFCAVASG
jgi:hypothetical protein